MWRLGERWLSRLNFSTVISDTLYPPVLPSSYWMVYLNMGKTKNSSLNKNRDQQIREEFARRKKLNPRYSLRKFSSDCGLSPSFVGYLIRGLRSLSFDQYVAVSSRLGITLPLPGSSQDETKIVPVKATGKQGRYRSTEFLEIPMQGRLDSLSWIDIQIADLTLLKGFKPDIVWMGKKLNLPASVVSESVEKLIQLGVLQIRGNLLIKKKKKIYLSASQSLSSLRKYHRDAMHGALQELSRVDEAAFKRRLITGATLTLNDKLLPQVQEKLNNFVQEVIDLAADEDAQSLYQLNLQFFPLTR